MKKISFLIAILILVFCVIFAQKIHIVKKGDTLWDIAGYYYNNPYLWRNIYNANMDKIEDPHWIYPGQEFIIPDIPEDMTATTGNEGNISNTEDVSNINEREAKNLIIEKENTNEKVSYSKISQDEEITKIKAIREDIKKIERSKNLNISNTVRYAVAKKSAFIAGFVSKDNPAIGRIDVLYKNSYAYSTHEKTYVQLNNPDINNDIIGKTLIIFRWQDKIKNSSGEYLGKYVKIVGTIKIEKINENKSYGTIMSAYDIIKKGDFVGLYKSPVIPLNATYLKESNDIRAYLIATPINNKVLNEYSIVLVDIGKESGINSGDVFTVIRKNKTNNYYAAGALQILVPYNGYSTATMISVKDNIDIKPYEEIKLSYRNKNSYIINKYRQIDEIENNGKEEAVNTVKEETTEEPIVEEVNPETTNETPIVTEETTEPTVTEETTEPTVTEEATEPTVTEEATEPTVTEEATEPMVTEEATEEPIIIEETAPVNNDTIIEEKSVENTDEGFTIEEENTDTTSEDTINTTEEDTTNDTLIIEGEDDIIIIEE